MKNPFQLVWVKRGRGKWDTCGRCGGAGIHRLDGSRIKGFLNANDQPCLDCTGRGRVWLAIGI